MVDFGVGVAVSSDQVWWLSLKGCVEHERTPGETSPLAAAGTGLPARMPRRRGLS